jgi:hypothetical protein
MEKDSRKIEESMTGALNDLRHLAGEEQLEIKHKKDTSIVIHRGESAMRKIILRAITLNESERFYIMQGSYPDDGWARIFNMKNIVKINAILKKKKIIGESVIPDNYFRRLVPYFGKAWAISYVDRMNVVYMLPEKYFPSRAEILIFRNRAIILNMPEEIAVEIKNLQVLTLLRSVFEIMKDSAQKINMREELKKYL